MVKVICRIKPPIRNNTLITQDNELLFIKTERGIDKKKYVTKYYKLDKFYNEKTSNIEIYNNEVKPLLINSFYLFLYGHTGSGKTYTLFGNDYVNGIFHNIFNEINYKAEIEAIELRSTGSYNLLNNKIVTLLENDNKIKLYNSEKIKINNKHEFNSFVNKIKSKRKTGISKYNNQSSRTHLIINIYNDGKKFVIVDLAGNERAPEMVKGINYDETTYINSTLLALKECFRNSSIKNNKYIPYRRSKLTRLLKDVFETKVNSLIISTIHSGHKYENDTYDTLLYLSQFHQKFETKQNDYHTVNKKKKLQKINTNFKLNNNEFLPIGKSKYSVNISRPHTSPKVYKSVNKKNINNNLKPLKKNNNYINYSKNDNNLKYQYKKNDYHKKSYFSNLKYNDYDDYKKNNNYKFDEQYKKKEYDYKKYDNNDDKYYKNDSNNKEYDNYSKSKNQNDDKLNYKNSVLTKYQYPKVIYDKETIRMLGILNHILYTRSVKNLIHLNDDVSNRDKIDNVLSKTMATIEVVLEEIKKIYNR
jgi:hypothetical protein